MIYVFLANGFEEIEAMSVIDILRRADLEVTTVGVGGSEITGAHGVKVVADLPADEADFIDVDLMVLPGGQPGADNLTDPYFPMTASSYWPALRGGSYGVSSTPNRDNRSGSRYYKTYSVSDGYLGARIAIVKAP
jgi:hypothetical protein